MQSRNEYEAKIRVENLAAFLPAGVKQHLTDMLALYNKTGKSGFSCPEWTDLRVRLAEAMAAKAGSPAEVLLIWQEVLHDKGNFKAMTWPPVT